MPRTLYQLWNNWNNPPKHFLRVREGDKNIFPLDRKKHIKPYHDSMRWPQRALPSHRRWRNFSYNLQPNVNSWRFFCAASFSFSVSPLKQPRKHFCSRIVVIVSARNENIASEKKWARTCEKIIKHFAIKKALARQQIFLTTCNFICIIILFFS